MTFPSHLVTLTFSRETNPRIGELKENQYHCLGFHHTLSINTRAHLNRFLPLTEEICEDKELAKLCEAFAAEPPSEWESCLNQVETRVAEESGGCRNYPDQSLILDSREIICLTSDLNKFINFNSEIIQNGEKYWLAVIQIKLSSKFCHKEAYTNIPVLNERLVDSLIEAGTIENRTSDAFHCLTGLDAADL